MTAGGHANWGLVFGGLYQETRDRFASTEARNDGMFSAFFTRNDRREREWIRLKERIVDALDADRGAWTVT